MDYKVISVRISNASNDKMVDAAIDLLQSKVNEAFHEGNWRPCGALVIAPLPALGMLFCRELTREL